MLEVKQLDYAIRFLENYKRMILKLRDEKVETLNDLKSKLKSYDSKVTDALWQNESDREKLDNELETCDEYQNRICTIVRKLSNLKFEDIATMRDGSSFVNSTDPLRQNGLSIEITGFTSARI